MPWKEKSPMNERTRFLSDHLSGLHSVSELCRKYGISRKTGYKWIARYEAQGPPGLGERTSRPLSVSRSTPEPIVRELLAARERHPPGAPRSSSRCSSGSTRPGSCRPRARPTTS